MRPLPGDDTLARPRSSDNDSPSALPLTQQHSGPQMTYVLADESTVDVALEHASAILQPSKEARKSRSNEPVDASSSCLSLSDKDWATKDGGRPTPSSLSSKSPVRALRHHDDDAISLSSKPESPSCARAADVCNPSQPMTPTMFGTPGPMSTMSSVSSRRHSFTGSYSEDLACSQVLSEEGGDAEKELAGAPNIMDSGSAPQLIMPSIKMPSRRPFTETGKAMGRLKVLIAGDSGIGKTSLIKAIVQSCNHIVHVDPITPSSISLVPRNATASPSRRVSRRHLSSRSDNGTSQITEVYASTKPYPEWWSDLDDSRILKRRKSVEDAVLDRNICFVDTPGYSSGPSAMETVSGVVQYVESQLHRMSSNSLPDGDMLNMVGGDGGVQVDVVFYMISKGLKPVDIEYMRQLAPLTNVVVLLAQADLLSPEQIASSKQQIERQLQDANIKPFCFAVSQEQYPYAISSALGSDHDNMDASLLMSPDYVQPLTPSELDALVEQVFSQDGTSWLRHAAARKYIQWRKAEIPQPSRPLELYNPLLRNSLTNSYTQHQTPLASQILAPPLGATSSFALARIADHTQREERLAQIRLANWAFDLQKSLANERARYESMARGERAVWLTERLNECVQDGTLVPVSASGSDASRKTRRPRRKFVAADVAGLSGSATRQDPLGLLEVVADLRRRGLVVLEVVGGLGVLGGVLVWAWRQYGQYGHGQLPAFQWMLGEWDRFWFGAR